MGDRGNVWLRRLDFAVGIPLVWLLGRGGRGRGCAARPDRIGVLATAAIGDTILMSAVLADVAQAHPQARQTLFVGPSNREIATLACPWAEVVPISVENPAAAVRAIRAAGRFDWWLDFGPWPRLNALLSRLARADHKLGFRTAGQHRHFAYHHPVEHRGDRHELENLRALAGAVGVTSRRVPQLTFPAAAVPAGAIVVHMFPGGYLSHFKAWRDANWVALLAGLCREGLPIVLTGGAKDRPAATRILAALAGGEDLDDRVGRLDLGATGRLLQQARLVISVNTGIMHLAAAVGAPLIALHGPANIDRWGPVAPAAVNFCATSRSAGCLNLGFEYDQRDPHSLDTVDPEAVLAAARGLLAPAPQGGD